VSLHRDVSIRFSLLYVFREEEKEKFAFLMLSPILRVLVLTKSNFCFDVIVDK